ncbi:MAG TPA: RNA polymerase sigma-70 factor [Pelobium sp.]|nr:RNA polymerase sigma-70 factor [Pelobium sp.]
MKQEKTHIYINQNCKPIENLANHTESELIALWKKGDDAGFTEIYKRYSIKLISLAINKTQNRDDAEELVQNSFLKFYQHKDAVETNTSLFAFLYVILKNQILNYHRRQLVHQKYEAYVAKFHPQDDNHLQATIESKDLERLIEKEIEKLPDKCRNAFLLSRRKNLSNKEIAAELNISENTVEQHMRKALGRLRVSLKDYIGLFMACFLTVFR